jgi:spoIIIJ-associated protein
MQLKNYLLNICKHSGINEEDVTVNIDENDQTVMVQLQLPEEDSGLFIGFHGETLNGLQRLVRVLFQEEYGDKKIILNVNEYREQREEKVREMAENIARRVLETGQSHRFSFLPPHERFIIHTTISENPEFESLESVSEGDGRQRVLTIRVKAS